MFSLSAGLLALALSLAPACATVPVTGRNAFNMFSTEDDRQVGAQAFQEVLATEPIASSGADKQMVERVMQRLVAVADDPGFDWEVVVIQKPETVNAFCLPGGKMAVYTGILPVAGGEAGLATVMGHEIGHAVARHGMERLSQEMVVDAGLSQVQPNYQELASLSTQLALSLPYSRKHELEADHIGLIYMARAGYDPREAVEFWKRMSAQGGGAIELLSTHPSDANRVAQLEELLPEAMAIWSGGTAP